MEHGFNGLDTDEILDLKYKSVRSNPLNPCVNFIQKTFHSY